MVEVYQGDVLKIEHIKPLIYVVSKKFFNDQNAIIGCPIVAAAQDGVTHISINEDDVKGTILCEQLRFFDLNARGFKVMLHSELETMVEFVDIVQVFFDF